MGKAKAKFAALRAETKRMLAGQEGREVDFKRTPDAVKPEDLVAFANGHGGTILVGVDEVQAKKKIQQGRVVGCDVSDKTRQAIVSAAASCRPAVDIHISVENTISKPILRLDIPEGPDKPYCTASGLYKIRADGQNIALEPALMKAMILHQEADEFIARFRMAAEDVISHLSDVHQDLAQQIQRAEEAATEAAQAAMDAQDAAMDRDY
jgi:ATP-dependent DNA helicase RecG